jgi:hypothetical protein
VACTLGGPGEGFRPATRQKLREYLTAVSPKEWPIRDYMPATSPVDFKFPIKLDATRETLRYAPADDDLTHTMIAQVALSELPYPAMFQSTDLISVWFRHVPYSVMVGGTGQLALRNLVMRYPLYPVQYKTQPASAYDWNWIATHCNPFREDIDAAIRADAYGYAVPGWPELAAELAFQDARISNVKNGIYCSMFYAAMVSAAFALDDPLAIVNAGLAEIPATSRLYAAAKTTIEICRKHRFDSSRIEQVHDEIYATFGDDHMGTPQNMSLVVSGLLMSEGDFEKAVTYTVMGGWDCDSTAATTGSVIGAMLGAKKLPKKWIAPLNDTVHGQIVGYQPIAISECAKRSVAIAERMQKFIAAQTQSRGWSLPKTCTVFGPIDRDMAAVSAKALAKLPKTMTVGGVKLQPRNMRFDADGVLDLSAVIGATGKDAERVTAYVFVPFTSDCVREMMFGFGADWWFTAYVDGKQIATSEPNGNGRSPARVGQYLSSAVTVAKGSHVLAIRFCSGTGGSTLAVGGPECLCSLMTMKAK